MNIQSSVELSARSVERPPVLVVTHGRGSTGSATFLAFLIQRARRANSRTCRALRRGGFALGARVRKRRVGGEASASQFSVRRQRR